MRLSKKDEQASRLGYALLLSDFVAGTGQILLGSYRAGVLYLVTFLVCLSPVVMLRSQTGAWVSYALLVPLNMLSAIGALRSSGSPKQHRWLGFSFYFVLLVGAAGAVTSLVRLIQLIHR